MDGFMVCFFVEDQVVFNLVVDFLFYEFDVNVDGVFFCFEFCFVFEWFNFIDFYFGVFDFKILVELIVFYDFVFQDFDIDYNDIVDLNEF